MAKHAYQHNTMSLHTVNGKKVFQNPGHISEREETEMPQASLDAGTVTDLGVSGSSAHRQAMAAQAKEAKASMPASAQTDEVSDSNSASPSDNKKEIAEQRLTDKGRR